MFATSGYFKGVDCPYYLSGLCERPYCHLRHVKKDGCRDASSTFTSSSNYVGGSRPSSPLDPALSHGGLQCSGPTGSKPVGPGGYLNKSGPTGNTSCAVPFKEETVEEYSVDGHESEGPLYEPTPKYDITVGRKKRQNSTDCQYKPGGPAVEVPEYEPNHAPGTKPDETPVYKPGSVPKKSKLDSYVPSGLPKVSKSQAKKRRANPAGVPDVIPEYVPSAVPQYNPTPINQLKRMKKTPDTESEYDPVNNYMYSTNPPPNDVGEVVYVPTKRSKIEGEDDMFMDEFGGSDNAKFSDDDHEDESELIMDSGRYESPLEEESDEEVSEIFAVKPFFKDTISDKPAVDSKVEICENELKHPIRKPASTEKKEGDKTSGNDKKEQCEKSEIDNKLKDKLEKSSKHSSSSKSSSSEKGSDASKKKDKSASSSKSSSKSSKASDNKSAKHSSSTSSHKRSSSSEKSHSSNGASHNKSKHSEKDKSRHKENGESDKSRTKESSVKDKEKQSSHSSSSEKKHKSDSQKSHSSSHKQRSSSKDSTHHHRDSRDKSKESDGKKSHSSHSRSSSSSHSHGHSSKSSSKSEKENKNKHEKSKSSSSKSPKDKDGKNDKDQNLAHINADLFGSESEEEGTSGKKSNNNSHDMTDAELAMFLEDSDFECETDTFEECLKIFNEEAPSFKKQTSEKKAAREHSESTNASTSQVVGKKRVGTYGRHKATKRSAPKPAVKMSPAEVMHNRLMEMQRRALEAAEARKAVAEAQAAIKSGSSSTQSFGGGGLKRTAHMPKLKSSRQGSLDDRDDDKRTVAITVARGEKRKAHAPTLSNVKRPTIPAEFGSKVPSNIRQRYLNLIIDECLKICKTEEEAYKKGQEEEAAVYKRATNKNIYLRVAVNAIKRLRVEVQQSCSSPTKSPSKIIKQSHEATLGGKNATKTTYTLHRSGGTKAYNEDFRGAELYKRLSKYILTEEQLRENGYPRPSDQGGSHAKFYAERKEKDVILKQHEKNCARCGKRFIVFPNGNYNREEECVYHWGKAWKKRVDRALVSSYNCCGGDLGTEGCQVCKYHVFESNKSESVTGYMKTIPSSPPIDGDYGVYAMDCEMVYTKGGMELARVTVIDPESKPVYETLVKPGFPVIDYNTRFSGLTEKHLQDVTTSLRDVQAVLLSLFTDKTILIGHSLESDLISVKIIHNTVVDTSVVFPHRLGPPYKRALRNLMVDFLQKIIQDDVGGHDSQEDAVACLQLMQWKLKEDALKEVRRV
ncbi:LOW QUALITY PROTEIN: RNA exonuclease 1 homolog [Haliotis rubra]|uniref:LOW QUALITY PROTEIN: RNA exonuclease 1 homolog n=1 Tax=Haliotis rubra TaxID=36100 RepID=UPI001EE5B558|nr:LOW QUALITY PROTEIN: RNA exonuclease 1 homolog [Haliotis rubra]